MAFSIGTAGVVEDRSNPLSRLIKGHGKLQWYFRPMFARFLFPAEIPSTLHRGPLANLADIEGRALTTGTRSSPIEKLGKFLGAGPEEFTYKASDLCGILR